MNQHKTRTAITLAAVAITSTSSKTPVAFTFWDRDTAFYIQDKWNPIKKLVVNLGHRYVFRCDISDSAHATAKSRRRGCSKPRPRPEVRPHLKARHRSAFDGRERCPGRRG